MFTHRHLLTPGFLPLLLLLLTAPLAAQEICDNGLDDDGDGLIDLLDTDDCNCNIPDAVASLLPNPSFEEFDADQEGCTSSQVGGLPDATGQVDCVTGWVRASDGTTDSWNAFTFSGFGPNWPNSIPQPIPSGSGVAGFWANVSNRQDYTNGRQQTFYREYLGACLNDGEQLVVGEAYRLDLQLGFVQQQFSDAIDENGNTVVNGQRVYSPDRVNLTLYGIRNCDQLRFEGSDCVENSDASGWEPITTFMVSGTQGNWTARSVEFTPNRAYAALALGASCEPTPLETTQAWRHYYFIDDLRLNTVQSFDQPVGGPVNVRGTSVCDNDIQLIGTAVTAADYQWYKNGVAIVGQTDRIYRVDPGGDIDGDYQLRTTTGAGCSVSAPVAIQRPIIPENIIQDSFLLCPAVDSIFIVPQSNFAARYTWSDGSTERFFRVGAPGDYSVTISTPCERTIERYNVSRDGDPSFTVDVAGEGCYFVGDSITLYFNSDWGYSGVIALVEDEDDPFNTQFLGSFSDSLVIDSLPSTELLIVANLQNCGSDSLNITLPTRAQIDFTADLPTLSCANPVGRINLTTAFAGEVDYQWFDPDGNEIPGAVGLTLEVDRPGNYRLRIIQSNGCETSEIFPAPFVDDFSVALSTSNIVCVDRHSVVASITAGDAPFRYAWFQDGEPLPGQTGDRITDVPPGSYRVDVTDNNDCTTEATLLVQPVELLTVLETQALADCEAAGGFIITEVSGGTAPYRYVLPGRDTSLAATIPVPASGDYAVTVIDANGCTETGEVVTLSAAVTFEIEAGADRTIQLGEIIRLFPSISNDEVPGLAWNWRGSPLVPNADSLSCGDCRSPEARPTANTVYTVTATSAEGCFREDSLFVNVSPAVNYYFPTAFSPNGDGVNDFYQVFPGIGVAAVEQLEIYDRWGQLSYAYTPAVPNWDGRVNGKDASVGPFVYSGILLLLDGRRVPVEGGFTLVR